VIIEMRLWVTLDLGAEVEVDARPVLSVDGSWRLLAFGMFGVLLKNPSMVDCLRSLQGVSLI